MFDKFRTGVELRGVELHTGLVIELVTSLSLPSNQI